MLRSINASGDLRPLSVSEGEYLLELRGDEGFFENRDALLESNPQSSLFWLYKARAQSDVAQVESLDGSER